MTSPRTTRSIRSRNRSSRRILFLFVLGLGLHTTAYAEDSPACRRWLDEVAQEPQHVQKKKANVGSGQAGAVVRPSSDPWEVASLPEAEKMKAIECLLSAENDLRPAAFSGATRFDISQMFAPARVNLAALYAVSYIYSGHYDHAAAVALRGDDASYTDSSGSYVTKPSAIHEAYKAYRAWFVKVRQIGLVKAQRAGVQPLAGTGLRWY